MPKRAVEPPVLYRLIEYAPIEPTMIAIETVINPTITLRNAACKTPVSSTRVQFARFGEKKTSVGLLSWVPVLKDPKNTQRNGAATAMNAPANRIAPARRHDSKCLRVSILDIVMKPDALSRYV